MLKEQDYQEIKATVIKMEHQVGKANTLELLEVFTEWSETKKELLREFLNRYREEEANVLGNMANIILGTEDKREYDRYMFYIVDCYHRMASNRDLSYRAKQMELAGEMLDQMTELLEGVDSSNTI